eukprot:TRINITY_DN67488_c3_g3_i1.p1 TRINITY_DN67488_c3_g3~~TRINITY_DN67488_c3_g3_i1.p1  ORF type:complete len:250 (+),score=7.17 TRINITY_DN67488_c3_g3_i1:103-852(+)
MACGGRNWVISSKLKAFECFEHSRCSCLLAREMREQMGLMQHTYGTETPDSFMCFLATTRLPDKYCSLVYKIHRTPFAGGAFRPLCRPIIYGRLAQVRWLVECCHLPLNETCEQHYKTPLQHAQDTADTAMVEYILQHQEPTLPDDSFLTCPPGASKDLEELHRCIDKLHQGQMQRPADVEQHQAVHNAHSTPVEKLHKTMAAIHTCTEPVTMVQQHQMLNKELKEWRDSEVQVLEQLLLHLERECKPQ